MFSPNKTSAVYEKTSPISDLRWKPTGRIFKSVGLRWIPTRKLFDSYIRKVDSEPPHGTNVDIPNIHECKQTLDVSAGTSINVQKEQSLDLSAELCVLKQHQQYKWSGESAGVQSNSDAIEPKTVRKNSFRPPVIEDWNFDDESEVEIIPKDKTVSSSTEKIKFVKTARETVEKVETSKQNKHYPRWN
ncbi:hypothetical protein Tco_0599700 [Tanacetum coccineum]